MQQQYSAFTRRRFLQALGVIAGAAVIPGLAASPRTAYAGTLPISGVTARIGLLLADSPPHQRLRAGFERAFAEAKEHGARLNVVTQAIDHGPSSLLTAAEQLIRQERVGLLMGFAGPHAASQLSELLAETDTPFLAADTGANAPRSAEQSPDIFYNTLGDWQASWAMGAWAARNLGRRALIASSLRESGYDAIDAFHLGFEAAGGTVLETVVTHVSPGRNEWSALMTAIRSASPDVVHALYTGPLAPEFLQEYTRTGLRGQIPLSASAFLVDEALQSGHGTLAAGVLSCLSWAPDLPGAGPRVPDAFTALGYDTAQLLLTALGAAGGPRRLSDTLASAQVTGPRGRLRMNPITRTASMPIYLRQVQGGVNRIITPLSPPGETDARLAPLRDNLRTGWLNAHLSV